MQFPLLLKPTVVVFLLQHLFNVAAVPVDFLGRLQQAAAGFALEITAAIDLNARRSVETILETRKTHTAFSAVATNLAVMFAGAFRSRFQPNVHPRAEMCLADKQH